MKIAALTEKFLFGIYPGGAAGGDDGLLEGPPEQPALVEQRLGELQGTRPFAVRAYEHFKDSPETSHLRTHPPGFTAYLKPGRTLDLVLGYLSAQGDVEGYVEWVRGRVRLYAPLCSTIQICEEPNFTAGPTVIDGPHPRVLEAVVAGVVAAREELRAMGRDDVRVGFNSTPTFGASAPFWQMLAALATPAFYESLGYVGLDFFPDVFRPAPDAAAAALTVLEIMRAEWLPAAGIGPSTPIEIAENGWPTGPERSEERQALVLESIIRTVHEHRARLNLRRFTAFSLRDADSTTPERLANIFCHFGLTREDYSPKPAFETYRRLIAELG